MEKMFKDIQDFMANMANLEDDVREAELKKFSALDRNNIKALEYIAADIYPQKKVDRKAFRLTIKYAGKLFYPIVGWDPDAAHPASNSLVPIMRRWLSTRKQVHLHNPRENRTYTLYM